MCAEAGQAAAHGLHSQGDVFIVSTGSHSEKGKQASARLIAGVWVLVLGLHLCVHAPLTVDLFLEGGVSQGQVKPAHEQVFKEEAMQEPAKAEVTVGKENIEVHHNKAHGVVGAVNGVVKGHKAAPFMPH